MGRVATVPYVSVWLQATFNAELSGGEAVVLISDHGAMETSDESRSRVAAIQRFTWA